MKDTTRQLIAELETAVDAVDANWPWASENGLIARLITTGRALATAVAEEDRAVLDEAEKSAESVDD